MHVIRVYATAFFLVVVSSAFSAEGDAIAGGPTRYDWFRYMYLFTEKDTIDAAVPTADGGVLYGGSTFRNFKPGMYLDSDPDAYVIKENANREREWVQILSVPGCLQKAIRIIPAGAGGSLVFDRITYHFGRWSDLLVHRLDAAGNELWRASIPSMIQSMDVIECADGGFAIAGNYVSDEDPGNDAHIVIRLGADGTERWTWREPATGVIDVPNVCLFEGKEGMLTYAWLWRRWTTSGGPIYSYLSTWRIDASGNTVSSDTRLVGANENAYVRLQRGIDGSLFFLNEYRKPWSKIVTRTVMKMDRDGAIVFVSPYSRRVDGFVIDSLLRAPDGGYFAIGDLATKLDGAGNLVWSDDLFYEGDPQPGMASGSNNFGDHVMFYSFRDQGYVGLKFHDAFDILPRGRTLLEAENFRSGGEGYAFHDTDAVNRGGAYRPDGVDIGSLADGPGYFVGWTAEGEWLAYDIRVRTAANYILQLRVARAWSMSVPRVQVEIDGAPVTGMIDIPGTAGDQAWTTIMVRDVPLPAGEHELKLVMHGTSFNLDWLRFERL